METTAKTIAHGKVKTFPSLRATGFSRATRIVNYFARVQRYNTSWVPYFTQYAVLDVDDAGLITFVRAFSEPTNDKANAAGVAAAE